MKKNSIKKIVLSLMLWVFAQGAQAQGFNVGVNVGYALGAGNQVIGVNSTASTAENVKGSYGQGLNLGLNLNYMFSENLGADLGFGMLMGKEYTLTDNSTNGSTRTDKLKGSMIRIMPGIKVSTGESNELAPYGRFGLVLGVGSKIKQSATSAGSGSAASAEYELSEGSSFGWYGAFGLAFRLSEKIKLNAELTMINQTWGAEKYENTSNSTGDPLDPPVTLTDNATNSTANTALKSYFPFGSIGLNAGIQIGF